MNATRFRELHHRARPLLLPNAWDVLSARVLELGGAEAVATSSAALAWALGHRDGQRLPFEALLRTVEAMARALRVPLTVDLEQGYLGSPEEIARRAAQLADVGAVGINLEDAAGEPRVLEDRLLAIRALVPADRLFLNARTCLVLRGAVPAEAVVGAVLERARRYQRAGADGLFVPALVEPRAIQAIAAGTALPLNLMVIAGLPGVDQLAALGVRRVSAGPRIAEVAYSAALQATRAFLSGESAPLVGSELGYPALEALLQDR